MLNAWLCARYKFSYYYYYYYYYSRICTRNHLSTVPSPEISSSYSRVAVFLSGPVICIIIIACLAMLSSFLLNVCHCPLSFLPERDYVTFGSSLSQNRLSVCLSVTLMHRTHEVEAFSNISLPLSTLAILWPLCKILWRSSQGNPSIGCVKRKRGNKIEPFWTCRRLYLTNGRPTKMIRPRLQLMTNRKWHMMNSLV